MSLNEPKALQYKRLIFLVEASKPFFCDMVEAEWRGLQMVVKQAESILWITRGGLMSGREPLHAMISGVARGLKTEKNELSVMALDLDSTDAGSDYRSHNTILSLFARQRHQNIDDAYNIEYREHDGIIYCSSLEPDILLDEESKIKDASHLTANEVPLGNLTSEPLHVNINESNEARLSSFIEEEGAISEALPDGKIEVKLHALCPWNSVGFTLFSLT